MVGLSYIQVYIPAFDVLKRIGGARDQVALFASNKTHRDNNQQ